MSTTSAETPADLLVALADALVAAEDQAVAILPLSGTQNPLTLVDAYAVQRHVRSLRERRGERLVGHKVGLTSTAMREMLGVDEPDFGFLTDRLVCESGAVLSRASFIAPLVEPEIAFRMGSPLAGETVTAQDVLAATEAVAPALEVVDSRIVDWRIGLIDTVADNASCGRVVLGAFRPLGELDLARVEVEMRVASGPGRVDETVSGDGAAVLGGPAEAVAWLTRALHRFADEGLEAGQIVLPGAMTRALPVDVGDSVQATFCGLGDVQVAIGADR
jgi:2-keto-4-pentenoate hydratase